MFLAVLKVVNNFSVDRLMNYSTNGGKFILTRVFMGKISGKGSKLISAATSSHLINHSINSKLTYNDLDDH